jgi:hypothetical protein
VKDTFLAATLCFHLKYQNVMVVPKEKHLHTTQHCILLILLIMSLDRSVGEVTGQLGFNSLTGTAILILPPCSEQQWGSSSLATNEYQQFYPQG